LILFSVLERLTGTVITLNHFHSFNERFFNQFHWGSVLSLLVLAFLPFSASSQMNIQFNSSLEPSRPELFIGVDNKIEIKGNTKSVTLTVSHGSVYAWGHNGFLVGVDHDEPDTLKFYEGRKLINQLIAPVNRVPQPVARLGGLKDTVGSIRQLMATPFLSVGYPGSNYKSCVSVTSFSVTLISGGDTLSSFQIIGNLFSEPMKNEIKKLGSCDYLYFDDIRRSCPSCKSGKLPPFKFIIQDPQHSAKISNEVTIS